jgi:hypothetical protein
MNKRTVLAAAALITIAAAWYLTTRTARYRPDPALASAFQAVTENYRKIIVLMDGAEALDEAARARCVAAGRQLFWQKQRALDALANRLSGPGIRQLNEYLTEGRSLHDGDKLAFLDLVDELPPDGPVRGLRDKSAIHPARLSRRGDPHLLAVRYTRRGGRRPRKMGSLRAIPARAPEP